MSGPGLRRLAPPDLDAIESEPALVEAIRDEIERDGPITFARFMERALYEPGLGYYRSVERRPGRAGDFLTAPEAHPIFGGSLARFVEGVWSAIGRPDTFTIREFGAGGGALAEPLLARLAAGDPALAAAVRYRAEEVEPRRLDDLRERLAAAGLDRTLEPDDGAPIVGAAIANEVLDALPTHRVVIRRGRLHEVLVGWRDGAFADIEGDPSTPALARRLEEEGVRLDEGQQAEVCLELDRWVGRAAAGLGRGVLLLVDYGDTAERLYDPRRRPAGTVLAYLRHRAHDAVYRAIGRQDLTAHVDVTAVESAAASSGLDHLGTTTQGRFLAALGAGKLLVELQGDTAAALPAYLEARAALVRMIDPAAMGAFKVMVFGRGVPAGTALPGFAEPH
ncbi:MAG TPA: SAM-dependent methyltransferase [Candidatus Limnocylindrales bacterium]|nr:SAM-dependent methyltransferase [Candidatus Limnocylindrales bacterium]